MGARGALKVVAGGGVVRAAPDTAQSQVPAKAPAMPPGFEEDEFLKALWENVVPGLDAAGLLCEADSLTVATALVHYATAFRAYQELDESVIAVEGDIDDGGYVKRHPAEHVLRMESDQYLKFAKELGMTWMSRARTTIRKPEADGGNPFEPSASASG